MSYPKLRKLREDNPTAAYNMVAEIACGVHAGNEDMSSQAAAKKALQTAEEILTQLSDRDDDG